MFHITGFFFFLTLFFDRILRSVPHSWMPILDMGFEQRTFRSQLSVRFACPDRSADVHRSTCMITRSSRYILYATRAQRHPSTSTQRHNSVGSSFYTCRYHHRFGQRNRLLSSTLEATREAIPAKSVEAVVESLLSCPSSSTSRISSLIVRRNSNTL